MKKWTAILFLLAMLAVCAAAIADVEWATVNNPDPDDRLNLRAKPSADAISYGKYYNGTQVQILSGPRNGWYRVRVGLGNGVSEIDGYMMARYLAVDEKTAKVHDARPVVTIHAPKEGFVLVKEFYAGSNVGKVYDGEQATVLGVGSEYLHIVCGGDTGMVPVECATPRLYFSENDE